MQLGIGELIGIFLGLLSVAFNVFLLYREHVRKSAFAAERDAILSTVSATLRALIDGQRALSDLEHKGADARSLHAAAGALIEGNTTYLKGLLQRYGRELPAAQSAATAQRLEAEPHSTHLVRGVEAIETSMIKAIENAEHYLMVIGGRSRNERYLNAIKQRVGRGDVRYVRVVTGDHIRHPLCLHLNEMWDRVELGYLCEDKYGGVLVTHETVVLALYSSTVPALDKGLVINDPSVAADYRLYVLELLGSSDRNVSLGLLRSLCTTCRSSETEPDTAPHNLGMEPTR